ncbi:SDR family NAD(P)-dependent oxidoreductase [Paralcaligenes ureilyticus]|uniref:NAD(P)-dependent dehydrogenase (Short-subunit alcohol dehydrogenase family) n=1 Tax=Paralcaligenes ureilyticus TaxID=627131 RepID=A0A4R3MAQ2_9BURK|nr:SDR family NAD(P)-dependent oxidoreductase [Paralcaligenes ureilyticus]TCT10212.1 NAD(P)-dependent dehydrogenase (short-subunit alcohol dehydrogenase family) [Paralcaligenes ureilyticus]
MGESHTRGPHLDPISGRLQGRAALITGGGSGIGRAAAELFARQGAQVAVAEIRPELGRSAVDAIEAQGGTAFFVQTDVTQEASVQEAVNATVSRFGKLDLLFNCAGGSSPQDALVTDVSMSVWDATISLDLKGTFLCCRYALPHMIEAGGGAVVNMSSGAALRGSSPAHVYTAAKGAIVSLTRALAGAYARHNIRVNAICSGRVNTERVRTSYGIPGQAGNVPDPMNVDEQVKAYPFWFGEPEDMANIALFLASDDARMITGAAIPADGGRSSY